MSLFFIFEIDIDDRSTTFLSSQALKFKNTKKEKIFKKNFSSSRMRKNTPVTFI